MKFFSLLALSALLAFPALPVLAYSSNICAGKTCTPAEVGVFMQDITGACANTGDCSIQDIMLVFVNVGNFVVGIIGGIVLLMYVIGGFLWLVSAGNPELVKKGKGFIRTSTIGLLIVMFSYLGIFTLRGVLQSGQVSVPGTVTEYAVCIGSETKGQTCGLNMTCTENGTCESLCVQEYALNSADDVVGVPYGDAGIFTKYEFHQCIDTKETPTSDNGQKNYWYTEGTCEPNKCPGNENVQCCLVSQYK